MALDRQSIEKRDFPIGRRGYDPAAVDEHLSRLADETEVILRANRAGGTLAGSASDQVRLIVEAAEQSASEIEGEANREARRIRQEATEAAEAARTGAGTQAREHVGRVNEAATSMLERLETMETELRELLDGVRSGATRVASELSLLQDAVGELRDAPAASSDPQPDAVGSASAVGSAQEPSVAQPLSAPVEDEPIPEPAEATGDGPADEEGARLIAFNMALNGSPREETAAYIEENFDLPDADGLLDDVYAQAGL